MIILSTDYCFIFTLYTNLRLSVYTCVAFDSAILFQILLCMFLEYVSVLKTHDILDVHMHVFFFDNCSVVKSVWFYPL